MSSRPSSTNGPKIDEVLGQFRARAAARPRTEHDHVGGAVSAGPGCCGLVGTEVECSSAVARLERGGMLDADGTDQALSRLDALRHRWQEIQPVADVKMTARRFLRVHPLRAPDALELAAAFVASERRPSHLGCQVEPRLDFYVEGVRAVKIGEEA